MSASKFEEFIKKVTSRVKSKEAHSMIEKELTNHLKELSHSFQKRAPTKEAADEQAIQEMGNPFVIGENLNRLHKPKIDWVLLTLFVMIAGISFLPLIGFGINASHYIGRQAIWYSIAVFVLIAFLFVDYRKLQNWWLIFYGSGFVLLLYTSVLGIDMNGAKRWVSIWGVTVDVTIFSLFLFFLAWAGIFSKVNAFNSWFKQVLLFFFFWTPILIYMMLPHLTVSIIYCFSIVTMFTFSNVHKKIAIKLVVANVVVGIVLISTITMTSRGSYLFNRLFAFINPEADPYGAGYTYLVVRDIFSQAGWFGHGLHSDTVIQSLPAAHTDFAFPFLVYSLGWTFGITLCLLLVIFFSRIAKHAFKTQDLFGRLLVIGSSTLLTVPASWNILMGFAIVPIMEVSLPFISYGGSMLLFYCAILGIILNVYRRKDIVEPNIIK